MRSEVIHTPKSTPEIMVFLATELPFWVPIESGSYSLFNKQALNLHNDFWLVSVGNMIDGPFHTPWEFVVNELQVLDKEYLKRIAGNAAKYYHKKKMKTTFTRAFSIRGSVLSAEEGTESWWKQLQKVVFSLISIDKYESLLNDVNSFLNQYCALISTSNTSREVRSVGFYDIMFRVLVRADTEKAHFLYSTQLAPDLRMADFPFPLFRVRRTGESRIFGNTIQNIEEPGFHQLQWTRALNHYRENRYQEALLSAAITLETLAHMFLSSKGFKSYEDRDLEIQGKSRRGLAGWLKALSPPDLIEECKEVASLWILRNDVVHNQRRLLEKELAIITRGVKSLGRLRQFLLKEISPNALDLEEKFSSFLEQIPLGIASVESMDGNVPISKELRFEKDHYQVVFKPQMNSD